MAVQRIESRIRGFISLSAHPDGCARNVAEQAAQAEKALGGKGLGRALVLGSSTGYGLGSLLACAFGLGADTLGVCLEKAPDPKRTGTAGWYNMAAAIARARAAGKNLDILNGDAFSHELRAQVIAKLKGRPGKLDMIVYSLASPRRKDPASDTVWSSVLKPIGASYSGKTIDLRSDEVSTAGFEPASDDEIAHTVKVMGGEDWQLWIDALAKADLLAAGCRTVAYSYIGPEVTYPIYRSGTIGRAKEHIESTAKALDRQLQAQCGGHAWISVNKALVTQASAAIPVVPLYISILFKIMKEQGSHEDANQQIVRLFRDHLGPGRSPKLDAAGRIRLDDRELAPAVQTVVTRAWQDIATVNLHQLSDYTGFKSDFAKLFGFGLPGIDYDAPVETEIGW